MHLLKVLLQVDDLDIKYNTYSGNTKNEIIHMRTYLRKILEKREFAKCLVVLTDVQDYNIIKAFDLNCKMFITTRHFEKLEQTIPSKARTTIDIDQGFTPHESLELFTKAFRNEQLPPDMPPYIEKFHDICNGHPFIMSLIAKTFQNFEEKERTRQGRCEKWLENLGEYKLQDKDNQIIMSVEESLKLLTDYEQICYKKMVIFTDNSDIPFKVLDKVWDTDSELTENIVLKFHKNSLIEKPISEEYNKACSLHYLHFHFLKQHVSPERQREYHQHLVEKYEVEKIFRTRKELDLNFPDDNYFHYFIPYHLVGAGMIELFDLYLDFGFLEQKMRITKLPNTVGDLIRFEKEIHRNQPERETVLMELIDFLTNNEQMIFKSNDVNLLQCALTSYGSVQKEAQKQMRNFADRVWMNDLNHEANQTQIVQLTADTQPKLVRFVQPNDKLVCLISLQDNNILLHDIAQNYSEEPILFRNELSHNTITDMQIFRNQAFLTLNDNGKLSVYTLKSTQSRKMSRPSRVYPTKALDSKCDKLLQRIEGHGEKFTCFNVFEFQQSEAIESAQSEVDLIVGTSLGNIKFYQWKINKFEENKKMTIKTDFIDLFRMAHVQHEYVMLLNSHGDVRFYNLINSSSLGVTVPWNKVDSPINLHQGICFNTKQPISLCVSKDKVIQVTHEAKPTLLKSNIVHLNYEDLFEANDEFDDNRILSSTMSKDAEYLILGTTKGIIIIDRFDKKVVFRRNISDQVLSLDIYRYQDEAMYILSSVFKDAGHIISLYGFTSQAMMSNEMSFFIGEELFDIDQTSDDWQMVAVDSKRNLHFRLSSDDFTDHSEKVAFKYQIKKICCIGSKVIVGCTNGSVFEINQFDSSQKRLLAELSSEITYLECVEDTIVASCNSSFKIVGCPRTFYGKVTKAYRYKKNQILLFHKDCSIEIFDTENYNFLMPRKLLADNTTCSAQAFCGTLVVIAATDNRIYLWKIDEEPDAKVETKLIETTMSVTSLALSADKNILAVGWLNGTIEVCIQLSLLTYY